MAGSQRLAVKYDFDDADNVVKASNSNSNEVYWELLTAEDGVRIKQERLGNAACGTTYGTTTAGVVTKRTFDPHTGALDEVQTACGTNVLQDIIYQYTDAHRTHVRHDLAWGSNETYGYDAIGRIQTINSALDFTYRAGSRGLGSAYGTTYYAQGDNNEGSAVFNTYWTGSAGDTTYHHDDAGDQTQRTGSLVTGGSQAIDYTQFDLPKRVTQNGGYLVDFSYDASGARMVRATDTFSGTPSEVTYYDGDLYQRIDKSDGSTTNRNMIYAGGRLVAVATTTSDNTTAPVVHYVHDDAIGSIETITSPSGSIEAMRRFDLYGNEQGGSPRYDLVPYGFTGQEHDVDLGLINMHGRIYDPMLGEFLTPDPLMSNPSGHGINAFAYVENDPLNRVDPSGFEDTTIGNLGSFEMNGEPVSVSPMSSWEGSWSNSGGAAGSGIQSYAFDSATEGSGAADAANVVSDAARDVAVGISAGRAAVNFFKHLSQNVQRKPAPHSTSATAPGGSGAQSAGRSGSSAVQTRREAVPVQEGAQLSVPSAGPKDTSQWLACNGGGDVCAEILRRQQEAQLKILEHNLELVREAEWELFYAYAGESLLRGGVWLLGRGAAAGAKAALRLRPDIVLSGGRSGELVKNLTGPANSVLRGGGERAFVTDAEGKVILDVTKTRVKQVIPGQGFGPKRAPTEEELNWLQQFFGGG